MRRTIFRLHKAPKAVWKPNQFSPLNKPLTMAAMKSVFLAAALAVALVAAAAASRVALEADVPVHLPSDVWMNEGAASPSEPMQLTFALKQRNVDALEAVCRPRHVHEHAQLTAVIVPTHHSI